MPTPDTPAIAINGLRFAYRADDDILRGVNLTVPPGAFMAILGPNGGGKSTLLKLIMGLLTPWAGEVLLFGHKPAAMRSRIGYVPQYATTNPLFPATVLDMTLSGAARQSLFYGARWPTGRHARAAAFALLETVGLTGLERAEFSELSGGQKQRVMLARALISRPADGPYLLLLDEPTAGIDPQGKFCLYEFLAGLKGNVTTLVVSHDLSLALGVFSSVALVNRELALLARDGHEQPLENETLSRFFGAHEESCHLRNLPASLLAGNYLPLRPKQEG